MDIMQELVKDRTLKRDIKIVKTISLFSSIMVLEYHVVVANHIDKRQQILQVFHMIKLEELNFIKIMYFPH